MLNKSFENLLLEGEYPEYTNIPIKHIGYNPMDKEISDRIIELHKMRNAINRELGEIMAKENERLHEIALNKSFENASKPTSSSNVKFDVERPDSFETHDCEKCGFENRDRKREIERAFDIPKAIEETF